jgi:hypothetical protein
MSECNTMPSDDDVVAKHEHDDSTCSRPIEILLISIFVGCKCFQYLKASNPDKKLKLTKESNNVCMVFRIRIGWDQASW